MTPGLLSKEEREEYRLRREPLLRLVFWESLFIATPFDERDVLRFAGNILLKYGQLGGLDDRWTSRGIYWIPGLSKFRWMRRRWGYMHISTRANFWQDYNISLSVLFDAVSGELVRFSYHDSRVFRWFREKEELGEIPGGLVDLPQHDDAYRRPNWMKDEIENFVATTLRNNALRAAGLPLPRPTSTYLPFDDGAQ